MTLFWVLAVIFLFEELTVLCGSCRVMLPQCYLWVVRKSQVGQNMAHYQVPHNKKVI